MQRILVVYYSRTGHTQKVAEAIAADCGADLEAIRDVKSRRGFLGYWRSGREAWLKRLAKIGTVEKDPDMYDLVVLGTPVWAGQMSSPMRSYITQQRSKLKRVALFCTEGGAGGKDVLSRMGALCGLDATAGLVVTERELKFGIFREKLAEFTQSINQETSTSSPAPP